MSCSHYKPFSTIPTSPFIKGDYSKFANQQYTDSTRNKGEGINRTAIRRAAAMRRERAAALRTLATLELMEAGR